MKCNVLVEVPMRGHVAAALSLKESNPRPRGPRSSLAPPSGPSGSGRAGIGWEFGLEPSAGRGTGKEEEEEEKEEEEEEEQEDPGPTLHSEPPEPRTTGRFTRGSAELTARRRAKLCPAGPLTVRNGAVKK
ncbi:hypothetical protein EYF80_057848 [Liparis tanakae]|uniref:Uncharacterized protein n=1 Tax=Liparis tanakae TaxID=230148 RepID=A0A4Z2ET71_9TELE|nr:hypothetical protein EYF80_057848 [Liparis tanakae]